jgi:MFS family permease
MFFFGLCAVGRISIGYVYLIEFMPKKYRTMIGTIYNCFNSFIVIEASLYFDYISKYWLYFELLGISLNVVAIVGILILPESPKWYYAKKDFINARRSFNTISKINKAN